KTAKKSHWIAQGETKEGIAVVSYDETREEAVVKVNGIQKTLPLRKVATPVGGARTAVNAPGGFNTPAVALPSPVAYQAPVSSEAATPTPAAANVPPAQSVAAPPPPPPGSAAETQVKQETEARMLVS